MKFMSVSDLTHKTSAKELRQMKESHTVMANAKPVAVLIPYKEYMEWQLAFKKAEKEAEEFAMDAQFMRGSH